MYLSFIDVNDEQDCMFKLSKHLEFSYKPIYKGISKMVNWDAYWMIFVSHSWTNH